MPPEATPRGAEISWGPFLVPYGGTYHELFLPGGVFCFLLLLFFRKEVQKNIPDTVLASMAPLRPASGGFTRGPHFLISSCFRGTRPGGIAGKIPPAPLTIGGCPYRILAGMAPGHNWGGA